MNNNQQFETELDQYLLYHIEQQKKIPPLQLQNQKNPSNTQAKLQLQYKFDPKVQKSYFNKISPYNSLFQPAPKITPFKFQQSFQSANLKSVSNKLNNVFYIKLNFDTNSQKVSQWYYFSCIGIVNTAKFIISGFSKQFCLYNKGMLICVNEGEGWFRGGENIKYQLDKQSEYYELKYEYKFTSINKKVYFAYSFPYTYSDLEQQIRQIQKKKLNYVTIDKIGKSLLTNNIYQINIGNKNSKQIIILTARVHPSETQSSYILKGVLQFLLSQSNQALLLIKKFLFKIYPMLNPDGVIRGNSRLSYSGNDLNRKWTQFSQRLHPQIINIKKKILQIHQQKKIRMMIDIHGHSKKKNLFFYGCISSKNLNEQKTIKQFPYLMSKIDDNYSFQDCCFQIQKQRQGTLRIAMHNYLKIPNVYTLEASFCGKNGSKQNYLIQDYINHGKKLAEGMLVYYSNQFSSSKNSNKLSNLRNNILDQLNKINININQNNQDCDNSDNDPSEGCFKEQYLLSLLKIQSDKNKSKFIIKQSKNISNVRKGCWVRYEKKPSTINQTFNTKISSKTYSNTNIQFSTSKSKSLKLSNLTNDNKNNNLKNFKGAQHKRVQKFAQILNSQQLNEKKKQAINQTTSPLSKSLLLKDSFQDFHTNLSMIMKKANNSSEKKKMNNRYSSSFSLKIEGQKVKFLQGSGKNSKIKIIELH